MSRITQPFSFGRIFKNAGILKFLIKCVSLGTLLKVKTAPRVLFERFTIRRTHANACEQNSPKCVF